MKVYMYRERFIEPILTGVKRQTVRPRGLRQASVGDMTSHRFWDGLPYRSKQIEIAIGPCVATFPIAVYVDCIQIGLPAGPGRVTLATELDKFARADGFESWDEMIASFTYELPFDGELIQWRARRLSYSLKKLAARRPLLVDTGRLM